MINEYEQGGKDMLAMIKDIYYKTDISTFEKLLDAEDENEVRNFLRIKYINQEIKIGRDALSTEIKGLAERYGIKI